VGSQEKDLVDQPGQIDSSRIISPLEDILPVAGEGILDAINHPMLIPEDDKASNDDLCLGSACLAEQKTPGRDMEA